MLIFVESGKRKMEILYTLLAARLYLKIRVREKTPKIRQKKNKRFRDVQNTTKYCPPSFTGLLIPSTIHPVFTGTFPSESSAYLPLFSLSGLTAAGSSAHLTVWSFLIRTITQNPQRTLHVTHA